MLVKSLCREAARFSRAMNDRSFDFTRRQRGEDFVKTVTLERLKSPLSQDLRTLGLKMP